MRTWLVFTLLVLAITGCSSSGDPEQWAHDREKSRQAWKLTLDEDGATHEIAVERMDIYLTEDESETEIFELHGDGVTLVGEIPLDARVDYGEAFENLIGKQIEIRTQGGDPSDPKRSKITLDGIPATVSAGRFTVERLSGKWEGSEGDRTLHGTIELHLRGFDGERTLRGSFGVHAVTWG